MIISFWVPEATFGKYDNNALCCLNKVEALASFVLPFNGKSTSSEKPFVTFCDDNAFYFACEIRPSPTACVKHRLLFPGVDIPYCSNASIYRPTPQNSNQNLDTSSKRAFTMAEKFLAQLPRVAKDEIPDNKICIVCHEEYGTTPSDCEPAEEAVRLPCPGKHIVGLTCITSWLLSDMNSNSCPYCRYEVFVVSTPLQQRARQLSVDHGQRLEHWMDQWYTFRGRLENQGATPSQIGRWELWFTQWILAATNINEEDIALARTARNNLFTRMGWSQMPADTDTVLWSETDTSIEIEPLASAIRTRHFREYWLCLMQYPEIGYNPGLLRSPAFLLTIEQKAAIFRHLCRIGAFRGVLEEVESENEKWRILRSQGYTFDEDRRLWSAYPF